MEDGETMRSIRSYIVIAAIGFAITLSVAAVQGLHAQPGGAALSGKVTSAAEGPMEGVVVTAKKAGSTISVSVISDDRGVYSFPASRLSAGTYAIETRAIGYDLAGPSKVNVSGAGTTADLKLVKTKDLAMQLSNAEWIASVPGTDAQKRGLLDCVDCHSLQRVVTSAHDANDWLTNVLPRMENYANMSFWLHPQPYPHARTGRGGFVNAKFAAYLASINLSSGPRKYSLVTFPRLKGQSTHVIITTYDLPSPTIEPHDVAYDHGLAWWSDFGEQKLGSVDPKTGVVHTYQIPEMKPGYLTGSLELEPDPAGNLWVAGMYQGGVSRFNPKTLAFTQFKVKPGPHPEFTQESMVAPQHMNGVDAKGIVWTNNQDLHTILGLNPVTKTWKSYGPELYADGREFHGYGVVPDLENQPWFLDFGQSAIGTLDPKTGQFTIIATPSDHSKPRRGHFDSHDVMWFAEYGANNIGRIAADAPLVTDSIKEYPLPTPWTAPYDVAADSSEHVWTGSMLTDRVDRLDEKTGKIVEYQLPAVTNIRRVNTENDVPTPILWIGNNHGASVISVQPLP